MNQFKSTTLIWYNFVSEKTHSKPHPRSLYFLNPSPDLWRGYLQAHLLIEAKKNAFIFKALQSKPPTLFWDTLSGCKEKRWKEVLQIVSYIKFYNKISYYLLWFYHRIVNNGQNTVPTQSFLFKTKPISCTPENI